MRRVLLHDCFGAADQILSLLGIDFLVDLSRQVLEFLVVPLRIVLRSILAVPGVEVVGGIEQCRYEAPDRQVVIAARTIGEPYRIDYRAQIAFDAERFFEHRLDRLRPELEDRKLADHEVQAFDPAGLAAGRHQRPGFLDRSGGIRLVARPLVALLLWGGVVRERVDKAADYHRRYILHHLDQRWPAK